MVLEARRKKEEQKVLNTQALKSGGKGFKTKKLVVSRLCFKPSSPWPWSC